MRSSAPATSGLYYKKLSASDIRVNITSGYSSRDVVLLVARVLLWSRSYHTLWGQLQCEPYHTPHISSAALLFLLQVTSMPPAQRPGRFELQRWCLFSGQSLSSLLSSCMQLCDAHPHKTKCLGVAEYVLITSLTGSLDGCL